MITYTQGNLLEAKAEALVNTVNTAGVMGKGVALMFKERFKENYRLYKAACKANQVQVGKMFVTSVNELDGPTWIVNFPTKQHWKASSKMSWIQEGLHELRSFLIEQHVQSVAMPPLGAGNGGLEWRAVREQIELTLGDLNINILVYEPTAKYQNVAKREGVKKLTPSRALIAELVRSYWILGMECSLLEVQKLAWFLENTIEKLTPGNNPFALQFEASKYGPYSNKLNHLMNDLDGSYLHCDKRIKDAGPFDVVWFDDKRKTHLSTYLKSEDAKQYKEALEYTIKLIDGFESPFGMELLATVDWLLVKEGAAPNLHAIRQAITEWSHGADAGNRKNRLFDDKALQLALTRLTQPQEA